MSGSATWSASARRSCGSARSTPRACASCARRSTRLFGYKSSFTIYDAADSKRLMTLVCRDLDLDVKRYQPRAILNWICNAQERAARPRGRRQGHPQPPGGDVRRRVRRVPASAAGANALDFDDLLMMTVHLFRAFPEVRETWRRRFRHVLVDEYQDTNHAQYALIHELCADAMEEAPTATGPTARPASSRPS